MFFILRLWYKVSRFVCMGIATGSTILKVVGPSTKIVFEVRHSCVILCFWRVVIAYDICLISILISPGGKGCLASALSLISSASVLLGYSHKLCTL